LRSAGSNAGIAKSTQTSYVRSSSSIGHPFGDDPGRTLGSADPSQVDPRRLSMRRAVVVLFIPRR